MRKFPYWFCHTSIENTESIASFYYLKLHGPVLNALHHILECWRFANWLCSSINISEPPQFPFMLSRLLRLVGNSNSWIDSKVIYSEYSLTTFHNISIEFYFGGYGAIRRIMPPLKCGFTKLLWIRTLTRAVAEWFLCSKDGFSIHLPVNLCICTWRAL